MSSFNNLTSTAKDSASCAWMENIYLSKKLGRCWSSARINRLMHMFRQHTSPRILRFGLVGLHVIGQRRHGAALKTAISQLKPMCFLRRPDYWGSIRETAEILRDRLHCSNKRPTNPARVAAVDIRHATWHVSHIHERCFACPSGKREIVQCVSWEWKKRDVGYDPNTGSWCVSSECEASC